MVDAAAKAAGEAFPAWRRTPVQDRVQYLFKLRDLLRANGDEIARLITNECGKTFEEARAEMVRAYENVEVACGMPMMSKGEIVEDIAPGIDEIMLRQPLGVCATIAPFNFPGMIPFWYLPYALATGNTYIIKPSEKVPMTMQFIMQLIDQVGFPKGVVNLVNGAKEAVDGILEHPAIRAVTFVGSTKVRKIHLCHGCGQRQTGAGAGRGEESGHRAAGCGHGDGDQDRGRFGLWVRRAALPGGFLRGDGGRGAQYVYGADLRCGRRRALSAMGWMPASRWDRSSMRLRKPGSSC